MTYYENDKAIFDYILLDANSATITKWHDVEGDIVVPTHINGNINVSSIQKGAFILTNLTLSITVSGVSVEEGTFDVSGISVGFSPIIKVKKVYGFLDDYVFNPNCNCLIKDGWEISNKFYGVYDFIITQNLVTYETENGSVKFTYRKISESEIEIIKWRSSSTKIFIPPQITDNLSVASLGSYSFINLIDLEKIYVPATVRKIGTHAFYYEEEKEVPSFCYHEKHKPYCEIYLPPNIYIEDYDTFAFARGIRVFSDRIGKSFSRFFSDLIVITFVDSKTCNCLIDKEWKVVSKNDKFAVLVHKSFDFAFEIERYIHKGENWGYCDFDFDNYLIELPEYWK